MKVSSMIELVTDQSWSNFQLGVEYNWDFIAFSCFVIGLKYSCYNLNQSGAVLKTVVTWSRVFSRACGRLLFFILRSYWLSEIFPSL